MIEPALASQAAANAPDEAPPEATDAAATVPVIDDAAGLVAHLEAESRLRRSQAPRRLGLAAWNALADACDEASWRRAERLRLPLVRLGALAPDPVLLARLGPDLARRHRAIPLLARDGKVAIAMEAPDAPGQLETLDFLFQDRVIPLVASAMDLREAIARTYDRAEDAQVARQLGLDPGEDLPEATLQDVERLSREKPVVRLVNDLLQEAVQRRASDVHLRPGEEGLDVLYRIDDELVPVRRFLRALAPAVVSRVKVLADMNLAEHRRPQDGRSRITTADGRPVDMRVSVLPSLHGESVVMRLLDLGEAPRELDALGFGALERARIDDLLDRPHGLFLATGPTGCGKSTTLYAMLAALRRQRINILTIEDPVERQLAGVQQMQVNRATGFDFATALRHFLRHDPDVVMVGEVRDVETARTAVESALTGHLVLSTLHTNSAATAITRLLEIGVEAYLLRASLAGVLAQRLVRLTCPRCAAPEVVPDALRARLGVGPDEAFVAGTGCPACEGLGVRGRRAVYELMPVSPAILALIAPGVQADALHRVALEEGMVDIASGALALARAGVVSLREAARLAGG